MNKALGVVFAVAVWTVIWLIVRPRVNAWLDRRSRALDEEDEKLPRPDVDDAGRPV